jgi:hypothetical protein
MLPPRIALAVMACSVSAALAVACAAPAPSNKTLVVDCDQSQGEDCSEQEQRSNARSGASSSSSGGQGPLTPDTVPDGPAPARDAGAAPDASASSSSSSGGTAARGPSCTALAACCTKIEKAGFTGSARQCQKVVATNEEYACFVTKADYAKPTDEHDAICP